MPGAAQRRSGLAGTCDAAGTHEVVGAALEDCRQESGAASRVKPRPRS